MMILEKLHGNVNNNFLEQALENKNISEKIINPKQKRYDIPTKLEFLNYMEKRKLEDDLPNLSSFAKSENVSRTTLYKLEKNPESIFSSCNPGPKVYEENKIISKFTEELIKKEEENQRLRQLIANSNGNEEKILKTILQLASIPVSTREIRDTVEIFFEKKISKSKIKKIIIEYSEKAYNILKNMEIEKFVEFLGVDEIFTGGELVLVGIDLKSFAVVINEKSNTRNCEAWHQALSLFPHIKTVVSDRAQGIIKSVYLYGNAKHQFDVFHFKRDAKKELRYLESQAYVEIDKEYKSKTKLEKTKLENKQKLEEIYKSCKENALHKIEVFDKATKGIELIFEGLDLFDSYGNFQEPSENIKKIARGVKVLQEIQGNKKMQNIVKQALNPNLTLYLEELDEKIFSIVIEWNPNVRDRKNWRKAVKILASHWYFNNHDKIRVPFKKNENKDLWNIRREKINKKLNFNKIANLFDVRILQLTLANFQEVLEKINSFLDNVFRASSLVESWNSQVRIVQQVKKNFGKKFLSLLAMKWNMTPFENGKRKGKSPFEILGAKTLENNWLDLLIKS